MHRPSLLMLPLALSLALAASGCGRSDSNPVGAGLFNRRDLGTVVRIGPILPLKQTNDYKGLVAMRNGSRPTLAVGSLNRIDMTTLIRFTIPTDTLLSASGGKDIQIASAQVRLTQRAFQAVGIPQIVVSRPLAGWTEQSVFADTLREVEEPMPTSPIGAAFVGSDADTTVIGLPASYVRSRLRISGRSLGELDTLEVAVQPAAGSSFLSAWVATDALEEGGSRPRLTLKIVRPDSVLQTVNLVAAHDTFYGVRRGGGPDAAALTVGTGFLYSTYLKFSLPDSIPKRATINSARLEAEVVQPGTFPASMLVSVDRLVVDPATRDSTYAQGAIEQVLAGSTYFTSNIGPFIVQTWTSGLAANDGVVIRPASPSDLLAWISLRNPRLTITYSVPPGTE